jgi:streptogrisin D
MLVIGVTLLAAIPASPAKADLVQEVNGSWGNERVVSSGTEGIYQATGMTPEVFALMTRQEGLDRVADDIRAKARDTETGGLAGIAVDQAHNAVRLYWHGMLPAAASQQIAQAGSQGIAVIVKTAPYTEAQLVAEVDRISKLPLSAGTRAGHRAMRISPKPDGTGIDVGISGLPDGISTSQARQLVPALNSPIPLTITPIAAPAFASRYFDVPAYWGGGLITNPATNLSCSNAFGVTGNNGAATYLLTAAHCGEGEWRTGAFVNPPAQNVFGNTIPAGRSTQLDAELILTPAGSANAVYYGSSINPPNNDVGTTSGRLVAGATSNNIDDTVCTSGAFSGTICDGRILATNVTISYVPAENGVGRVTNLVWAEKLPANDSSAIAGQGDSGGPVISVRSDGKVLARGIISGIDAVLLKPCQGWAFPGRQCSPSVFYADVTRVMNTVGVHLNVG